MTDRRTWTSPALWLRSRSGAALLATAVGVASVLAAGPAAAAKKKKAAPPVEQASGEDKPAAQAGDTERPKAIIDPNQEAPKTDSLGHIHFGNPNAENVGRVAVRAAPEAKIKVFLEGRYFGTAPLTIYSIPKGDYIVEATYPNGKQVSKPVTVTENAEIEVDLGGAKALSTAESRGSFFANSEMTPARWTWTKGFLIGAGVGAVMALTFGILEIKAESDYNNVMAGDPMFQKKRDDIESSGRTYALLTNIGIGITAAGLIGAAITGYPVIFRSSEKKMTMTLVPAAGPNLTGGVLTLRF